MRTASWIVLLVMFLAVCSAGKAASLLFLGSWKDSSTGATVGNFAMLLNRSLVSINGQAPVVVNYMNVGVELNANLPATSPLVTISGIGDGFSSISLFSSGSTSKWMDEAAFARLPAPLSYQLAGDDPQAELESIPFFGEDYYGSGSMRRGDGILREFTRVQANRIELSEALYQKLSQGGFALSLPQGASVAASPHLQFVSVPEPSTSFCLMLSCAIAISRFRTASRD